MRQDAFRPFGRSLAIAPVPPIVHYPFLGLSARRPRHFLGQEPTGNIVEELRRRGPIIPVQVGIPKASASQLESPPVPEEISALVDTGASITAINVATAQRLGLQVTGSIQIGGATGVADQPVYAAMLRIPDPFIEFDAIQLSGAQLSGVQFEMLIGRNILCSMLLAYDGKKGRFSLIL